MEQFISLINIYPTKYQSEIFCMKTEQLNSCGFLRNDVNKSSSLESKV